MSNAEIADMDSTAVFFTIIAPQCTIVMHRPLLRKIGLRPCMAVLSSHNRKGSTASQTAIAIAVFKARFFIFRKLVTLVNVP